MMDDYEEWSDTYDCGCCTCCGCTCEFEDWEFEYERNEEAL